MKLLPTPGGTATYCEVSALRRHSLSVAQALEPTVDREEPEAHTARGGVSRLPPARWVVRAAAAMDDLSATSMNAPRSFAWTEARMPPTHRPRGPRGERARAARGLGRSFAHFYDGSSLRRTHLRGHQNILKRLIVHADAFNLSLLVWHGAESRRTRSRQRGAYNMATIFVRYGFLLLSTW